jgi:hypothetical protein
MRSSSIVRIPMEGFEEQCSAEHECHDRAVDIHEPIATRHSGAIGCVRPSSARLEDPLYGTDLRGQKVRATHWAVKLTGQGRSWPTPIPV